MMTISSDDSDFKISKKPTGPLVIVNNDVFSDVLVGLVKEQGIPFLAAAAVPN